MNDGNAWNWITRKYANKRNHHRNITQYTTEAPKEKEKTSIVNHSMYTRLKDSNLPNVVEGSSRWEEVE